MSQQQHHSGVKKVLVSGGGTGGHIFPALAIANALGARDPKIQFLFVGAEGRMEMEKVPQAGYEIVGLPVAGFQRRLTAVNLLFPFRLLASLWKARGVVKQFKPDLAIGTGGYASGPVLLVAQRMGIPTLIQEQNSYPGVTNRLLARRADRICSAFADMEAWFPPQRTVHTGNPVREAIANNRCSREEGIAEFGLDPDRQTLFITGGSLGARVINDAIDAGLPALLESGLQIIWQTGKVYKAAYASRESAHVKVLDFVARMDAAYAAADAIVSRAGGTIAELCIAGKPCILLPSPNVAEDHQTKNVQALVEQDAAILIADAAAATDLVPTILALMADAPRREKLGQAIQSLALPHATEHIADEAMTLLGGSPAAIAGTPVRHPKNPNA